MARLEPAVRSGSLLKLYQSLWAPYYQAVLSVLGPTGVLLPFGDPHHGQPNATTFTTKGEEQVTFTWSEPLSSFDTPLDVTGADSFQGIVPVVTFNGTDENAITPDAAFWSVDDSGDNGFSIGMWVYINDTVVTRRILGKYDTGEAISEWSIFINATDKLIFVIRDESAAVNIERDSDAAVNQGQWAFLVATYDGTGGATAMDGATLYQNGVVMASTAVNNGSYVAMENGTSVVSLGAFRISGNPTALFDGKMAGGPLGPWFVTHDAAGIITADEVRALYDLGRAALGL